MFCAWHMSRQVLLSRGVAQGSSTRGFVIGTLNNDKRRLNMRTIAFRQFCSKPAMTSYYEGYAANNKANSEFGKNRFVKMSERSEESHHDLDLHKALIRAQEINQYIGGENLGKSAYCMQQYQVLINEVKPRCIIETGQFLGASAVWWANQCKSILGDHFVKVIGTDIGLHNVATSFRAHPHIEWIEVGNADLGNKLRPMLAHLPRPLVFVEDAHFDLQPLLKFVDGELLQPGDYLIVEDSHPLHTQVLEELGLYNEEEQVNLKAKKGLVRKMCLENDERYRVDTHYQDMFGLNVGKTLNTFLKRVA